MKKLNDPISCKHEWWEPDPDNSINQFPRIPKPTKMCRLCGVHVDFIPLKRDLIGLGWREIKTDKTDG